MSPSEVNLEKLRIPIEEIWRAIGYSICSLPPYAYTHSYDFEARIMFKLLVLRGQLSEPWQNRKAIMLKKFKPRVEILSRFHHENILHFIGYCDEENSYSGLEDINYKKVILVYEDASNGSLAENLKNKRKSHSWAERLKICIGVAKGLHYLHSGVEEVGRVIHTDVQSRNIMLDENLVPKIIGFDLSVVVQENQPHTQIHSHVHPDNIPDPIYHETGLLDTTTDVYSYGILMFEMLIGMVANEEKLIGDSKPQRLINIVRRCYDNRPEQLIDPELKDHIDHRSFHMFIDIAYRCISFNLKDRPTMDEVVKTIKEALDIHVSRYHLTISNY